MATNSIRRTQRAIAVNRLTEAAAAAADTYGIEAVEIPTFDKEPDYLVTRQIEAAADVLDAIIAAKPAKAAARKDAPA